MDEIKIDHIRLYHKQEDERMAIVPPEHTSYYEENHPDEYEDKAKLVVGGEIHDKFGEGTVMVPVQWRIDRHAGFLAASRDVYRQARKERSGEHKAPDEAPDAPLDQTPQEAAS